LFAALSYAVTQSGRSGGGVDKEQNVIRAAEIIEQASLIKNHIQRLYWLNEVDQVRFDNSVYNSSGTVYNLDGTSSTGETTGVFEPTEGIPIVLPSIETFDIVQIANQNNFAFGVMFNAQIQISGAELGTSLGDEVLFLAYVRKDICEQINKGLTGSTTIPAIVLGGGMSRDFERRKRDGGLAVGNVLKDIWNIGLIPGCSVLGSEYFYFDDIRIN